MTRLLTLCALFFIISQNKAQTIGEKETLRRIYEQTTIVPLGAGFMKNGVISYNKLFENALKKEFAQTPEAAERFAKSRWETAGYGSMITLGSMLTTAAALSLSTTKDKEERAGILTTIIAGQVLILGGSYKLNQAQNNAQNAVWLHNRAQILNETRKNPSLDEKKIADLYDRNTVQFASTGFYQNGRYQTFGFLDKNLEKLMHSNPMAMVQLKKAKLNKIAAFGLNVAGIAAFMISTTKNNTNTSVFGNQWFWGGYGCVIASSFASVKASNHISQAAWFYNRDAFVGN